MRILTIATVIMAAMNFSNSFAENNEFIYNSEMKDSVLISKTVYKKEDASNTITPYLKYIYSYDESGRISKKETVKWSIITNKWENKNCIFYEYTIDGYNLIYALWNNNKNDYSNITEKKSFTQNTKDTTEVTSYKWNDKNKGWEKDNSIIMLTIDAQLIS